MRKLKITELERLSTKEFKSVEKTPLVLVLDNIRSMHNVGSFFRTADAFRINAIYLCGITAEPSHSEVHKTALGAEDVVSWRYYRDTVTAVEKLRAAGYTIFAVEQVENSISLQNLEIEKGSKVALVFGNEVKGVQQEVINKVDNTIEIPQYGTKHSLNVSVSAGMVIWDVFKKIVY